MGTYVYVNKPDLNQSPFKDGVLFFCQTRYNICTATDPREAINQSKYDAMNRLGLSWSE